MRVVSVGKLKEKYLADGVAEYKKRLSGYVKLDMVEVPDEALPANPSSSDIVRILDKEGKKVLKFIREHEHVILLDLSGKMLSSEELADELNTLVISGKSRITFVIGGSLGVSEELRRRASFCWSMSTLTFPHQFVRLLVLEQVYRACRITRGERYHR
ncbi:MAG: 23S rRNA (pseudouridine(1915)-N(3))-methyltransferase RlmH [Methanogenium sp.]|nr:23S rRNA (pseudouridine(1915)-N(3))-methyltransferase RlmH [Methanogenium sp.]